MRVLIVDQDSAMLEATVRALRERCTVDAVTTKGDCLDLLRQNVFEVIVAGEKLEDGSGLELLGQVAKRWPATVRIFCADADRLRLLDGRLGPFQLFETLNYPIEPDQLIGALNRTGATQPKTDASGIRRLATAESTPVTSPEPHTAAPPTSNARRRANRTFRPRVSRSGSWASPVQRPDPVASARTIAPVPSLPEVESKATRRRPVQFPPLPSREPLEERTVRRRNFRSSGEWTDSSFRPEPMPDPPLGADQLSEVSTIAREAFAIDLFDGRRARRTALLAAIGAVVFIAITALAFRLGSKHPPAIVSPPASPVAAPVPSAASPGLGASPVSGASPGSGVSVASGPSAVSRPSALVAPAAVPIAPSVEPAAARAKPIQVSSVVSAAHLTKTQPHRTTPVLGETKARANDTLRASTSGSVISGVANHRHVISPEQAPDGPTLPPETPPGLTLASDAPPANTSGSAAHATAPEAAAVAPAPQATAPRVPNKPPAAPAAAQSSHALSDEPPPVVREARLIRRAAAQYPAAARRAGIQGFVDLNVTISPRGEVTSVSVARAEPADVFDKAAITAVRRYRYDPEYVDGLASEAHVTVHLDFRNAVDGP